MGAPHVEEEYFVTYAVQEFVAHHHQAVLVTHRRDDGLQTSPVRVLVDASGSIVACTRVATAKAKNLRRDPRFALCVFSEGWSGPWITIEGRADLIELPDALEPLRAFYLQRDGAIGDDAEFDKTMADEGRLIIRFQVDRAAGPGLD